MNIGKLFSMAMLSALIGMGFGCENLGGIVDEETLVPVPNSKADNYYSSVAREFKVKGNLTVVIEPEYLDDEAKKQKRLEELVPKKFTATGMYLTAYFTRKLEDLFTNVSYGGFGSMVRTLTFERAEIKEVQAGTFEVRFETDVAGPPNLMTLIPSTQGENPDERIFQFKMKKLSNADLDNLQRKVIIRNFNPDTLPPEQLDVIPLTIREEQSSSNAFPYFTDFMSDGVFDITLFQGFDYNESRSDIQESKNFYAQLTERLGFTSPVARFEDLKLDSGPFTRSITANGKEVKVNVYIYHSDMTTDRMEVRNKLIEELKVRDVFFYNGHAGPYFGFYLDTNGTYKIDYTEIPNLGLSEKKQLFVMNGCQTYSQYADMFYLNPAKDATNLDVFTTVNFSYGEGASEILDWLLNIVDNKHVPGTYYEIVQTINEIWWNDFKEVFYGIHGIDDNPKLSPYANLSMLGKSCAATNDCGDASANRCIQQSAESEARVCTAYCLDDSGCPQGFTCQYLASGNTLSSKGCVAGQ